jgi:LEA14-like dessication related protein
MNSGANMVWSRGKKSALWILVFLAATSAATAAARKNIAVSLDRKEIREMDSTGLILVFYLQMTNSSASASYSLTQYDYRVVVQGTDYFALRTSLDAPIVVERKGSTRISLPIKITYADLFERVPGIEESPKLPCYVTGLLIFSDHRKREEKVPFAFSGEFPIFKGLEVTIQPLRIKTLTIGGTEFIFSFSCRNRNSFEMVLKNLAYKIEIEGKPVSEGVIKGDQRIEGQSEKAFPLPVMLDFFEVGRDLFDIFQRSSVNCRLNGQTQAESPWGEIKIVLSEQASVNLVPAGSV